MIVLQKDIATEVIVTFTEKTTLSPVYYLLEIVPSKGDTTYVILSNITTSERFDKFTLTTTLPLGEYTYTAYQSSVLNPTISDVEGVVESGILIVEGVDSGNEIYR